MNKKQAMALLTLIADLYSVMQAPDEMPAPQAPTNGKGRVDASQTTPAAAATVD